MALYMCTCILKEHTVLLYFESEYVEIHIIKSSALEILPLVLEWIMEWYHLTSHPSFPAGSVVKNFLASAGDTGSIPESSWRSPGRENDRPLQYSCLENPMDVGYHPWNCKSVRHDSACTHVQCATYIHIFLTVLKMSFIAFFYFIFSA